MPLTNLNNYYALITGGSEGIGRAISRELAMRRKNLIIVALDNDHLPATAREISDEFNVDVKYFGVDLTTDGAAEKVYRWTKDNNLKVDMLINNAGFGNSGLLESNELKEYQTIMALNNKAMVEMTFHFINDLKRLPRAFVMNTSSMEATLPLPYKVVYTATKSFVYAFSLALREELKNDDCNVSVSVLCPGSVVTNEGGLERIKAQGSKAKLVIIMADKVGEIAIKKMLNGKRVIVPGYGPWWIVKIMKIMPTGLKMKILEKIFRAYK